MVRKKKDSPPPVNPMLAFQVATSYHQAVERLGLWSIDNQDPAKDTSIPHLMLKAFTCELYMKVAYAAENNGATLDNEHELNVLFSRLSSPFRDAVRTEWSKTVEPLRKQLPDARLELYANLKTSRRAFEDFRYFYEGTASDFLLASLPDLLRQTLLHFHPTLRNAPPLFSEWLPVPPPGQEPPHAPHP